MSEEEKELVRDCKLWVTEEDINYTRWFSLDDLSVLVNLIEKQQKEIENSISKDKISEIVEKERDKTIDGYIDWKYDENVFDAELNMINIIKKAILGE